MRLSRIYICCLSLLLCLTTVSFAQQPQRPEQVRVDEATTLFVQGVNQLNSGSFQDAVQSLKRVTELQPAWAEAHLHLGQAYEHLGDQEKYLQSLREANRIKPNDVQVLYEFGMALRANAKFSEAIDPIRKVVAAQPENVEVLYLLGNTYLMATKYDEAIETLNKVLVLEPSHSEARERLRVSSARKNLSPRLESIRQEVVQEPESARARAKLADAYKALGMFAEAETEFLKSLELDRRNFDYQLGLCVNYSEWGKVNESVECYKKVVQLKEHHVLYMSLGEAYERQGNFAEAIVAFQKSLRLRSSNTFSLYGLAGIYMKQGKDAEAIETLRKLLEIEPRHVYGNHALGLAYARTGNKEAAMQQYHTLQTLNPNAAADLLRHIPR